MKPLILLAEDDEDDAYFLLRALERAGDERGAPPAVTVVRDGQQALAAVLAAPRAWSLVILDLKMPRVDGLEALKAIRESPDHAALPVVILTASDEPRDREGAARLGATRYLRKPADTELFASVAREVLDLALPRA